jgi:malonate-semialdehyde dehydrogenase (acetylating)/methylmalonate-semialdehyde dehydrogenase
VLKPSEQDPMSTMRLVELAIEAGIPAGVLNVVHGGEDIVNAICDHTDIKAVSFVARRVLAPMCTTAHPTLASACNA